MKRHYSHRGNIICPTNRENHPDQIDYALSCGYGVEIDVWKIGFQYFLGHDKPQYFTTLEYLLNEDFLIHAKNVVALDALFELTNCFYHQNDDYTITSRGEIICYPGRTPILGSILMRCEHFSHLPPGCTLCSDYIDFYKDI